MKGGSMKRKIRKKITPYHAQIARILREHHEGEYFTMHEAAALVRVSAWTIRRYILSGHIKYTRIGSRIIISRQELMNFIDSRTERRPTTHEPA